MNTAELKKMASAASGWKLDEFQQSEDDKEAGVAHVGGKYEDGEFAEVMTIDTGLYYQDDKAIDLARFYAAANPAAILKLLAINAELVDALKVCLDALQRIREDGGKSTSAEIVAEQTLAKAEGGEL